MARDRSAAGTLLAARLLSIVDGLPLFGLRAEAVLARAGISRGSLEGPDGTRVPARTEHRLWQAIEAEAGDPAVGLRMAAAFLQAGMPSIEGYLARNAPTLRAVLVDMDRFARISDDRLRMVLIERDELAIIRCLRDQAPDRAQGYVECQFAVMVGFVHRYIGPVPLWKVHLRRPKPKVLAPYRTAFAGVLPSFGKPHNEMHFPRAALDHPVRGAEPALARILEAHARVLVERVHGDDPLVQRVRGALVTGMGGGRFGIARVANALGSSERTLRRQLRESRTNYRALVDEVRCEFACQLLAENAPIAEVAEQIGFRSTSAFQKAFARWMHATPSEYRRTRRRG